MCGRGFGAEFGDVVGHDGYGADDAGVHAGWKYVSGFCFFLSLSWVAGGWGSGLPEEETAEGAEDAGEDVAGWEVDGWSWIHGFKGKEMVGGKWLGGGFARCILNLGYLDLGTYAAKEIDVLERERRNIGEGLRYYYTPIVYRLSIIYNHHHHHHHHPHRIYQQ